MDQNPPIMPPSLSSSASSPSPSRPSSFAVPATSASASNQGSVSTSTDAPPILTPLDSTDLDTGTRPPPSVSAATRPVPTGSAAPAGAPPFSSSSTSSSRLVSSALDDDIEMAPIPDHRRRASGIAQPTGLLDTSTSAAAAAAAPGTAAAAAAGASTSAGSSKKSRSRDSGSFSELEMGGRSRLGVDAFSDEDLHDDEEAGLSPQDRTRKQKKKRRMTRLDQRIAAEKSLSKEEQREADRSVVRKLAINASLILLWYIFSLSISLYNKWMFDKNRLNFAFPLFTTSMHMLVQFGLSSTALYFVPSLRPYHGHQSDRGRSRHETEPPANASYMTKLYYLTRVGPCGAATSLDIGLGNMSLKSITLTFYTMCKSSSLAFVLIFAFIFRLEPATWRLVAIIATMTAGVILMVSGEVEFKLDGFILVISAAFFSGFRWALTQLLLLRNPATSNPFSSIFYLSPVMFVTLFAMAIPVEGFGPLFEGLGRISAEFGTFMTPIFLLFPGCIAFCMIASEFALLQRTSVVTLSIAGIFKEVITISAASLIFHDELTLVNFLGLLITLAAIIAYNYIKITKMRSEAQGDVHDRDRDDFTLSSSNTSSDADNDSTEETAGLLQREHGDSFSSSTKPLAGQGKP